MLGDIAVTYFYALHLNYIYVYMCVCVCIIVNIYMEGIYHDKRCAKGKAGQDPTCQSL